MLKIGGVMMCRSSLTPLVSKTDAGVRRERAALRDTDSERGERSHKVERAVWSTQIGIRSDTLLYRKGYGVGEKRWGNESILVRIGKKGREFLISSEGDGKTPRAERCRFRTTSSRRPGDNGSRLQMPG